MKKHWKHVAKEILGEEKFKEIEAINDKTYDLGLSSIWSFARAETEEEKKKEHPFMLCAKDHDLVYLVKDELVKLGHKKLAKKFVTQADKEFKKCTDCVANKKDSLYRKFESKLFYGLIRIHNFFSI